MCSTEFITLKELKKMVSKTETCALARFQEASAVVIELCSFRL